MAVKTALTDFSAWQVIPANAAQSDVAGLDIVDNPAPIATLGFYEGIIQGQYNIQKYNVSRSGESIEANVTMSRAGIVMGYVELGGSKHLTAESLTLAIEHQLVFAPAPRELSATVVIQTGRGAIKTIVPAEEA